MSDTRIYDVIIWGASGFTGRLVAEYFLGQYPDSSSLKWAVAGRNENKLKSVLNQIGGNDIPIIIADSMDRESLATMVQQTKVICTTVGPYAKYGSLLVELCVQNKTDYCDLTGEVQWMRKMIDLHHDSASANGTRIVHTCGFDSVPSDMGVFFTQKALKEKFGSYAQHIKLRVKAMKGGMSGGTYASLNYILEQAKDDPSIMKTLFDPYGLNPKDGPRGNDKADLRRVIFEKDSNSWLSPFLMAAINTKVVRRSHALAQLPYGENFMYDEAMMMGPGVSGRIKATTTAMAMAVMMGGKPDGILKKVTNRFMPDPGEGPSKEEREAGFYNLRLFSKMPDGSIQQSRVTGDRDPGYGSTSKMLGEAAVCLAKDEESIPAIGGCLTPSTALGDAYLERLRRHAGLTFTLFGD